MKDLIQTAKNILIIVPQELCFDTISSALGLAMIISNQRKRVKDIITFGSSTQMPVSFSSLLDFSNYKVINEILKKELVLSVNVEKGQVDAVRWREKDDKVQFIITPKIGDFEYKDVDLEAVGGDYDLVITVGCQSLESIGPLYTKNPPAFEKLKVINIDINPKNSSFGSINLIGKDTSISNWILEIAEQEGFKLTKDVVETLFKGIFWANEGFRKNGALQNAIEKLISSGSQLSEIANQMFSSLSIAELRYMGKIISNLKIDSDGVIVSKLPNSDIQGVDINRILYPEINVLSRVRDHKVAILISEHQKEKSIVRIYSDEVNVFEAFSEYSPVGNSRRVIFSHEGDINELEKALYERLKQKRDSSPPKIGLEKEVEKQDVTKKKKSKKAPRKKEPKKDPLPKAAKMPKAIEAPPISPIPPVQSMPSPPQTPYTQPPTYPSSPVMPPSF